MTCRNFLSRLMVPLMVLTALCASTGTHAQQRGADEQIVSRATLVANGELVELYQDGIVVNPAFLTVLEGTYRRIEKILGHPHDKATLGDKLRVYVTNAMTPSHVWHGYEHQSDPRGILILNRTAYQAGARGENATYAHELTHLFTWRFYSHTLREGLADYVALEILPGAAVGPNFEGYNESKPLPPDVLDLLGTTIAPPRWVNNDIQLRQSYYFGSYRFVRQLIGKEGLQKFMQLYASRDPETAYVELYGTTRAALAQSLKP